MEQDLVEFLAHVIASPAPGAIWRCQISLCHSTNLILHVFHTIRRPIENRRDPLEKKVREAIERSNLVTVLSVLDAPPGWTYAAGTILHLAVRLALRRDRREGHHDGKIFVRSPECSLYQGMEERLRSLPEGSIDAPDEEGMSPLHILAAHQEPRRIYLRDGGAMTNRNHVPTLEWLVGLKANVDAVDLGATKRTALGWAAYRGKYLTFHTLMITQSLMLGNHDVICALMQHGATACHYDAKGASPLLYLAKRHYVVSKNESDSDSFESDSEEEASATCRHL